MICTWGRRELQRPCVQPSSQKENDMSETELNPCPYPCGWKELDRLITITAAWFARRTADDDVPDDVREVGINLGLWARALCEFSRDNQPRPAVPDEPVVHIGFTNPHQIFYAQTESGSFYPDIENECHIPVYMLKRHINRLGHDFKGFGSPFNTAAQQPDEWQPMETAPKDMPIVGLCCHEADPYYDAETGGLTTYGAHVEGLSRVKDGPQVIVWGGEYSDPDDGFIPDWWFLDNGDFETAANPVAWLPLPEWKPLLEKRAQQPEGGDR